ncbi:MAG TPA: calcineurin-like phosphoesterase family protein [Opitutaceae bacterium]|jgi:hypothetical protein|nr:calcineurin-like phosphoesterase family protein [Opitutaceae bacterium]
MLAILAAAALLHGRVTNSATGAGLGGVQVSNGRDLATTAADGRYALPAHGRFVFVVKPAGWAAAGPTPFRSPLPVHELAGGAADPAEIDFGLRRVPEAAAYDVLVIADTQPANAREVGYLERSLTRPLARAGALGCAFGLTLGDVTYDRPDLYPSINAALAELPLPWFMVNGNHDLNLGIAGEHAVDAYESTYGPSTYAFHWGPALFIALNDVRHEGGPRYHGGLLPDQWSFLGNLLAGTPATTPVVLFCHIPLFADNPFAPPAFPVRDRLALFTLLRRFSAVLVLSGHTHTQRRVIYTAAEGWNGAAPLLEDNVAAACGGFWGGPLDAAGAPISTMSDGTPPGYAVVHVSAAGFAAAYHRRPDLGPPDEPSAHLSLHVPRVVAPGQGYVTFYVNDFDGGPDTEVRARVDDGGWLILRRVYAWDPNYASAYLAQDVAEVPPKTPRLPDPTLCFHLWRGFLPAGLALGPHRLTVRAGADAGSAEFAVRTAN